MASLHHENGEMWFVFPAIIKIVLFIYSFARWQLKEECVVDDDDYYYYLKDLVHNNCDHLVMYTFNEKVFSETLSYLTQSG